MVTGFTNSYESGYPNCYIAASQDASGALVCTGVGTYGDTLGSSFTNASSASATAPNWYGQTDVVVAAYAGRFYFAVPASRSTVTLSSSAWNVECSPSIWVSTNSANYTYFDSWNDDWHLNFDWITIATSASPGTSISCSASLTITLTGGGGSLTYNPPGSFSLEFFGA